MIPELARAILTEDLAENGLRAGDVGTVVHVFPEGKAYALEFMTLEGETIDVVILDAEQVRPVDGDDIAHARRFSAPQPVGD